MRIDLGGLKDLAGFAGAAVVDSETGLILGQIGGLENGVEVAAAANMDVLRAARQLVETLEMDDDVEDVIVALGSQYHFVRTISLNPAIFLYLRLDRRNANLALARLSLKRTEAGIAL